ncbi:MAG: pyridoxal phosphate-dependent aminotransferase family protein [Deltaproteobacteria bacterium]|nr:pyridoxal phosphate-dependent aminotransferase family protein [Deltaproteobacteria bacterium]
MKKNANGHSNGQSQGFTESQSSHKDIFTKCYEFNQHTKAQSLGLYPYFRRIDATMGNKVVCHGETKIMIGSNNYLGLAQDERVVEAAIEATRKFGAGCTGSRFLNGNIQLHEELEEALAKFLKREAVLLFSTGFFANQGALTSLLEDTDAILCDRENHASIIDGCKASPAKTIPFSHNSAEALERRLKRLPPTAGKFLVVDGVFSMSGDVVDLPAMQKVAKRYGCRVYVDEAHALGVLGPKGEGTVHHFGLNKEVDLVMGTFSKSLGSMGGFLAGSKPVIEFLRHKARCFMFTASLAPAVTGGVLKALQLMQKEPERIEQLWKNTRKMHEGFNSLGFNIGTTQSPVVPILIGSEIKALQFAQRLFEAGIFATPAVFPAVRYGEAIVRTSYMATHTNDELDYVLETFAQIGKELGIFEDSAYREGAKRRTNNGYDFDVQNEEGVQTLRADSGAHTQA